MTNELAQNEITLLQKCEKSIEKGLGTFVEVGQALLDIRDGKLYRASHRTFETYCKDRWDISRSRAYELIDRVHVIHSIAGATGSVLSDASDISARDVAAIKNDLPSVTAKITARVEKGEDPAKATAEVVAEARLDRQSRGKKPDPEVEMIAATTVPAIGPDQDDADEISELRESVASLEAEVDSLRVENKLYAEMKIEWEKGGFAEVIAGKDATINAQARRLATENDELGKWMRSAKMWEKRARDLGYSRNEVIDLGAVNG